MERLAAGADAAAGAWLAAITVLLCENLLWAGQPAGRPSGAQVIAYYSSNGQSVTIGDLIWVSGMLALVIAAWLVAERLHGPWGIVAGLLATLAAVLEIASAMAGFILSNGAASGTTEPARGLATWLLETRLYEFGVVALLLMTLPVAAILLRKHGPRGGALAAAGVLVLLAGLGLGRLDLAFPLALGWLGLVGAAQTAA